LNRQLSSLEAEKATSKAARTTPHFAQSSQINVGAYEQKRNPNRVERALPPALLAQVFWSEPLLNCPPERNHGICKANAGAQPRTFGPNRVTEFYPFSSTSAGNKEASAYTKALF
jgi:hypothetical protein